MRTGLVAAVLVATPVALSSLLQGCGSSSSARFEKFGFRHTGDEDLTRLRFSVTFSNGDFDGSDGGCVPGAAVGLARRGPAAVAGSGDFHPAPRGDVACDLNGVLEADEVCDDDNEVTGDGCDDACQVETFFKATKSGGFLTIDVSDPGGIPAGSVVALCDFNVDDGQNEIFTTNTQACLLRSGARAGLLCTAPNTDAPISATESGTIVTTTITITTTTGMAVTTSSTSSTSVTLPRR